MPYFIVIYDLQQFDVFLRVPRFPPPIKLTATIVESGVEHHNPPLISMDPYQLATTSITSGAGTAYPSGAPEFITGF
jgi:hypothetical protein